MKIFWRNSLILKTVTSRLWPRAISGFRKVVAASAMIVPPSKWTLIPPWVGISDRRQTGSVPFSYVLAGRGFILLRLGFFGGGTTSQAPPLATIFSWADLEK